MTEWQASICKTQGAGKEVLTEVRPEILQRKGDFVSKTRKMESVLISYNWNEFFFKKNKEVKSTASKHYSATLLVLSVHLPSIKEFSNFSGTQMITHRSDFLVLASFDQPRGKMGSPEGLCPHLSDFLKYHYVMRQCVTGLRLNAVTSPPALSGSIQSF